MKNLSTAARRKHATRIAQLQRQLREAKLKRWIVQYSWKHGYPKGDPRDWRSWRSFARVPILFISEEEARAYLKAVGFKGFEGRHKPSASIEVRWLKEKTA